MKNERITFDIPAIDNRKAALALHLGVDSENQADWDCNHRGQDPRSIPSIARSRAARCSSNSLDWMSKPLKHFPRRLSASPMRAARSRKFNLNYKPG